MTGWGLADLVYVGAVTPSDEALFALVDCAGPDGGLSAVGGAAPLWAMGGTHTASVELRGVRVPDARVVGRMPRANWIRAYDLENADAQPAVFGQLRATADFLLGSPPFEELGLRLARRTARLRAEAYALRDGLAPGKGPPGGSPCGPPPWTWPYGRPRRAWPWPAAGRSSSGTPRDGSPARPSST